MKFLFTLFLLTVTVFANDDDAKAGKKLASDAKVDAKIADVCKHKTEGIKKACENAFADEKAKKCSNGAKVKTVKNCCGDEEKKMFEGFKTQFEICQDMYNELEGNKLAQKAKVDAKVVDACKNDSADIEKWCKAAFPKAKAVKCVKGNVKSDTECCGADAKKMFEDIAAQFDDCKKEYKNADISNKANELAGKANIDVKIDDACKHDTPEIAEKCKNVFPVEKARKCLKEKVKEVKKCCGEEFKAMFSKVEELNQCEEEFNNPTSAARALAFVATVLAMLAAL